MTAVDREIFARTDKLRAAMRARRIDVFFLTRNVDVYYFTGSMQNGIAVVPVEGEPVFWVRRSVARAEKESAFRTKPLSFRTFERELAEHVSDVFVSGRRPVLAAAFEALSAQLFMRLQEALPSAEWTDGSAVVREVRAVKSAAELAALRKSAMVADEAFREGLKSIREGVAEIDVMAAIEAQMRRRGHFGVMRMRAYNHEIPTGVVAAGESGAEPTYFDGPVAGRGFHPAMPQGASFRAIRRNEPIMVDIGCTVEGYVTDQTRTIVVGELDSDLREAYECAERIMREAEKLLRPGVPWEEPYTVAMALAERAGLSDYFMGFGADRVKFLGHGIGLEVDEWPVLAKGFAQPLEPGMVLTLEPKFVFPGRGAVGIENTYVVTENGCEKLTLTEDRLVVLPIR